VLATRPVRGGCNSWPKLQIFFQFDNLGQELSQVQNCHNLLECSAKHPARRKHHFQKLFVVLSILLSRNYDELKLHAQM